MSWQLLTAVSVISISVSVLLQRILLHKEKIDPLAYIIVFNGLVASIIFAYSYIHGFKLPDFSSLWFPIVATIALYAAGNVAYAKALQVVEASIFCILFATNAIWTMAVGLVIFREHLSIEQFVGVVLIFASVAMLAERKGEIRLNRGILLGLITGVLYGLSAVGWVYVSRSSEPNTWTALIFAGVSLLILLTNIKSVSNIKPLLNGSILLKLLVLCFLFSISAVTLITAFQKGNVSLIAPLQQSSLILTIILAVIFLGERGRIWHKTAAAAVYFVGILLIV